MTAASVFTHIPLDLQRPWLEEIRRILRPAVTSSAQSPALITSASSSRRSSSSGCEGKGHVTLAPEDPGVSYATKAAGSWDVFQTREEVLRSFGSVFEVLHYSASESAQDNLVLRKQ